MTQGLFFFLSQIPCNMLILQDMANIFLIIKHWKANYFKTDYVPNSKHKYDIFICHINSISDLMLLVNSYLLYKSKNQIKYCANPGFMEKICQLCKTSHPSILSVHWCMFVELHLQIVRKLNVFSQHLPNS